MKKKKKGSSLILVIVVFAIISILGTSILGVTMTDYKMRIEENKKAQGLYNSEAGIDVSLNIMAKMMEIAISKANEVASKVNVTGTKEEIYEAKNEAFKTAYTNYLYEKIDETLKETNDGVERLKYCLDEGLWINEDGGRQEVKYNNNYNKPTIESTITKQVSMKESNITEELLVKITSEFTDEVNINRILETEYSISVPEYQSVAKSTIAIHPILNNLFSIHGNAYLSGNININGDVFVGGENQQPVSEVYDVAYNKYDNGIRINDKKDGQQVVNSAPSEINITGEIITPRSLYSGSNATISVDGDIYAGNVYLGKKTKNDDDSKEIKLQAKENKVFSMYLSNDLALNADNSNILMNNLYGLNDINSNGDEKEKARTSSSIIINSQVDKQEHKVLEITDKARIMGTAYINTASKYQTGESIAIKGNYIAYTSSNGKDDAEFIYDDPLQLIDLETVFEKANHIYEYAKNENSEGIQTKNVKLPTDTIAIGAYIDDNGKIANGVASIDEITSADMVEKKKNFVIKALNLGVVKIDENKSQGIDPKTLYQELFNKGDVLKTIKQAVKFNGITQTENLKDFSQSVVLNNDANKKVIIIGSGANNVIEGSEDIVIDISGQDGDVKLSGLIITAGDVEVYGKVDFNGAIISGGDFVSNFDSYEKTFTENLNLVQKLIAENSDKLSSVFEENEVTDSSQVIVTIESVDQYNINNYIENKLWKIVK